MDCESFKMLSRRGALKALSAWGALPLVTGPLLASAWQAIGPRPVQGDEPPTESSAQGAADSPYRLEFTHSPDDLIGDLLTTERGDPARESFVAHSEWYTAHTRRRFGSWGPEPRHYPPLLGLGQQSVEWQRERVVATAARFLGYSYQYHHIPDWNPPLSWPWKPCSTGHNGKGVDCSNLTSFVFNQGFGIRISSAIHRQADSRVALEARLGAVTIRAIRLPERYEDRLKMLRTGDLIYIRGREDGPISHVVTWVGSIGRSPSGVPLVLDSHGNNVVDDLGRHIPCGVQLRPFRESSWYNRCASHVHRIFGNA